MMRDGKKLRAIRRCLDSDISHDESDDNDNTNLKNEAAM